LEFAAAPELALPGPAPQLGALEQEWRRAARK
jgi:hypothetical protein